MGECCPEGQQRESGLIFAFIMLLGSIVRCRSETDMNTCLALWFGVASPTAAHCLSCKPEVKIASMPRWCLVSTFPTVHCYCSLVT